MEVTNKEQEDLALTEEAEEAEEGISGAIIRAPHSTYQVLEEKVEHMVAVAAEEELRIRITIQPTPVAVPGARMEPMAVPEEKAETPGMQARVSMLKRGRVVLQEQTHLR